ncbi:formate dehydrogenase alpha subunit [Malonomonas rubra DSM 5091]|uniref:Formate dehydrogenase alpha subunit n=1 Tax=Malonomonas rubra DSM 5091 TaxID=1122189 RepID=A0A1M6HMV3_MALRU|nr:molybdopterin-dependent oxidoreductase [Malonomonas rubra]SHJ23499.1 formate dehydrogenase alpha subunit [Malonomonas rubra DSM 5091]
MVSLTIDGKSVSVPEETTILEAARQLDIHIPTLCWLEKVSPTGACRICAVEIEGVDRPMTACNTPVKEGIVVTTQSEKLTQIRKQIMELILVNHPLDCPVCDAGGECDLQNTCYELGVSEQPFKALDVNPETIDRWPLIQQVPSRCVMCEKCVKVCHETVGSASLFVNDKGDKAFIDKDLEKCIFCGNCVSVCPTGTMISKPFKFKARPWALRKVPSVCTYCPSQCQIDINVQNNEIFRVTSDDEGTVNNGNLCIGGFFGYGYVNSPERLKAPTVDGYDVDWDKAMEVMVAGIENVKETAGAAAIAGLASPRLTNEENYLFQKLFRAAIGSNNIDSEARFGALRALSALDKGVGLKGSSNLLSAIGSADAVLVFGADPSAEAPAVDWQIQKATRIADGKLVIANMREIHLTPFANSQLTYKPGSEIALANALGRLLVDRGLIDEDYLNSMVANLDELKDQLAAVNVDEAVAATGLDRAALEAAADIIGKAENVAIVFGGDITKSELGTAKSAAVANLAILSGALRNQGGLFPLDEKGNMQGLLDMGVYPEALPGFQTYDESKDKFSRVWGAQLPDGGLDAEGILEGIESGKIKFLYLAAVNPQSFPNSSRWMTALEKVETLVVQDILPTAVTKLAKIVLPGASFAEKSGSVTSLDQRVRSLEQAIRPVGSAREDWSIFAELYGRLTKQPVTFSQASILTELSNLTSIYGDVCFTGDDRHRPCLKQPYSPAEKSLKYQLVTVNDNADGLQLLSGSSMSHFGTTSTWAAAPMEVEPEGLIQISAADADAAGVKDGDKLKLTSAKGSTVGKVKVSKTLPQGLLFAPNNFTELGVAKLMNDGSNRTAVEVAKV